MVDVLAAEARPSARRGPQQSDKRTLDATGTPSKRRRLLHVGSSPPPYNTTYSDEGGLSRTSTAPPSPRGGSKRNAPSARARNALSLRTSSPVMPSPSDPPTVYAPDPPPRPQRRSARGNADGEQNLRGQTRYLQRLRTLACTDPDSPIGTFGGQILPRSTREISRKGQRATRSETTTNNALVRGGQPNLMSAGSKTRSKRIIDTEGNDVADGRVVKQKRRQPKVRRVQFGGVQALEMHHPPNEAQSRPSVPPIPDTPDAADESEITFFPTLPPKRPRVATHMSTVQTADAALPSLDEPPPLSALAPSPPSPLLAPEDTLDDAGHPDSDGDSSRGLLEVLSQTALRRMDQSNSPEQSPHARHSPALQAAPQMQNGHDIRVEFDAASLSHLQARRIAESLVQQGSDGLKWTSVRLDSNDWCRRKLSRGPSTSSKAVRAASDPPTRRSVCDDLSLTAKQVSRKASEDRLEFVHFDPDAFVPEEAAEDLDNLAPFEHRMRFAGYRLQSRAPHDAERSAFPCLRSFSGEEWPTRRGPVVKILVPLSGPSLSLAASSARFIKPQDTRDDVFASAANETVLVWTPATARRFLAALDEQVSAGTQSSYAEPRELEASELELCPSPILHYVVGTGLPEAVDASTSNVALYVHAHRVQEARSVLAALELGDTPCGASHSFRPFSDPTLRLLVVSVAGNHLGTI